MTEREKKILFKLIILMVVIVLLYIIFVPNKGLLYQYNLEKEITHLTKENSELEKNNMELQEEIEKLKNDKEYLEEVARTKHGLLKKNEVLFEFDTKKENKK